eukprot:8966501-Alexandrium_andersonii.AAC.1
MGALEDLGFDDAGAALPLARWKTGRQFCVLGVWPTGGQHSAWHLSSDARSALDAWATAKRLSAASNTATAPPAGPDG